MILDGVLTHTQQLGDLTVSHTFGDLRSDLMLPCAQQRLPLRVGHQGWQALSQSLKNVPELTTTRPHLSAAHTSNAFDELAVRFISFTYTHGTRSKSLNDGFTIVFLQ